MSGLFDHEREALRQIELDLTEADRRLAQRLAHPGWLIRWRYGSHREHLVALLILAGLSLIPIIIALIQ